MVEEAIRQYRSGAVIALTWHAVRPTDDEPVTFRDSVQGHPTDFEWNELLTPGKNIHNCWVEQVDVIAGYLRRLQDERVPVRGLPRALTLIEQNALDSALVHYGADPTKAADKSSERKGTHPKLDSSGGC